MQVTPSKPTTPEEEHDDLMLTMGWPNYRPKTIWGEQRATELKPDTITRVINHPPNSTALINER